MKKIILGIIMSTVLSTTVLAHERRHYNHQYQQYEHHHRNSVDPVIMGIFGLLLSDAMIKSQNRPVNRYEQNYCADEQVVDQYGNVYWRRICPR